MKSQTTKYGLICLVSVILLFFALVQRDLWPWALLPCAVGGLSIALNWRMGSGLFLASLGGVLYVGRVRGLMSQTISFDPTNILMCGTALTFVICQARLLSLTRNILPLDPRRDEWFRLSAARGGPPDLLRTAPLERVGQGRASSGELTWLLVGLPIWLLLGQLAWQWLSVRETDWPIFPEFWRLILLLLGCSLLAVTTHVIFTVWRYATLSRAEAHLILQDAQWLELRKDQRLFSRWLARHRWRKEKKGQA
jgi:hypothetical protein